MNFVKILLIFASMTLSHALQAHVVLNETAASEPLSISDSISYLEDHQSSLEYSDIAEILPDFLPLGQETANFGFTGSTYWFHTEITNRVENTDDWLLEIGYPLLDDILIYEKNHIGELRIHRAGDHLVYKAREIDNRKFLFRLSLQYNEPTELFIRVKSSSSMQLPLKIYSYESYALSSHTEHFFLGLYYGTLAALFAYNLLLIFWMKDSVYVYYAGYLLCYGLFQLNINGLAYKYLWPESVWLADRGVLIFLCLAVLLGAKFSHSILQINKVSPVLDKAYLVTIGLFLTLTPFCTFADYRVMTQIVANAAVATCMLFFFSSYKSHRFGISTAKYYLISVFVFLIGIFVYALKSLGLVATFSVSEYTIMVGSTIEAILLSFALSHRFKVLKDENTRMQTEAQEVLEKNVMERTKELETVLDELSIANKRLEGLNNTDTLTGVRSRAYFDEHAEFVWKNTNRSNEELAIMMLDVDNFKIVNDNYGHLIGDEVLISVAQAINASLTRSTDQMARYGGEEFIVILPSAELEGVISIAEKIRKTIESIDTMNFGLMEPITISIGVAIEQPSTSNASLRDAIERADKALYQAKHSGKNCVIVYEYESLVKPADTNKKASGSGQH